MSEELLGVIRVMRSGFMRSIYEDLFLTPDRVIVARTSGGLAGAVSILLADKKGKELRKLSPESVLKADKHNYAIPNSEITKVELKKKLGSIRIHVETKDKKSKWYAMGIPEKEKAKTKEERKVKLEDYENILRPIFGDKLSTK